MFLHQIRPQNKEKHGHKCTFIRCSSYLLWHAWKGMVFSYSISCRWLFLLHLCVLQRTDTGDSLRDLHHLSDYMQLLKLIYVPHRGGCYLTLAYYNELVNNPVRIFPAPLCLNFDSDPNRCQSNHSYYPVCIDRRLTGLMSPRLLGVWSQKRIVWASSPVLYLLYNVWWL